MAVTFPRVRVGAPLRHESLSVFPLFSAAAAAEPVDYHLSDTALAEKLLVIEEVSEGGSVPELLVKNRGDVRVLFLEGEELVGAKQNRVLNTSLLVPAHAETKIPVSCVEQGRWGYRSRHFDLSGSHSPSKLRKKLRASVSRSVKDNQGHRSDQGEVWKEVASLHSTHGVSSDTSAMSDAFNTYQDRIAAYREKIQYVSGATGMAVAIGARVVSLDLFDKPATCEKVWDRMLSGVVFDALEAAPEAAACEAAAPKEQVAVEQVERLLADADRLPWEAAATPGEGAEYRAESPAGDHASALAFNATIVHGSVLTA